MFSVPLLLGFFGSAHCLGMCGPLAMGVSQVGSSQWKHLLGRSILYNLGRATTYAGLGWLVGGLAQQFLTSGWQQQLAFITGGLFILLFLLSITPDSLLQRFSWYRSGLRHWQKHLGQWMHRWGSSSSFILGLLNGLLPCGLVYIALAGSLAFSAAWQSATFMFVFGLGTLPALFFLMTGANQLPLLRHRYFRKALPAVQLLMGIFLIYRGLQVQLPFDLSWYLTVDDPAMCH